MIHALHVIQNNHNREVCVADCGPKCRLMVPLLTVQFPAYDDMHTISLNEKLSGPSQFWTGERQIKQMPYQKIKQIKQMSYQKILTEKRFRHFSWTQD